MGLTYWHLKKFNEAKTTFNEAQTHAQKVKNKSYQAMSLRQLSRPELNEGNPDLTVKYAQQARQLALDEKRQDLAWIEALIHKGINET